MARVTAADEDALYDFLQTALLRHPVARGILETVRLLERGKARSVIIAADVEPKERLDPVRALCAQKEVKVLEVSDKAKLGRAVGIEVAASCVALPVPIEIEWLLAVKAQLRR